MLLLLAFKLILITSVWCLGITIASQEGMVFHFIRQAAEEQKKIIYEPLILCVWCMPSIHTLFAFIFGYGLGLIHQWNSTLIFIYPIVVMGSSFLNGALWGIHQLIWKAIDVLTHIETLRYFDIDDRKKAHKRNEHFKSERYGYQAHNRLKKVN